MEIESLVEAIESDNPQEINRWSEHVRGVLIRYLCAKYRASFEDAQDCVHETLAMVVEKIRSNSFNSSNPGGYILASARNHYFKIYRENKNKVSDEVLDYTAEVPLENQYELVDEETITLLRSCIRKLNENSRQLIEFMLANPDLKAETVASEFKTTASNIWTRKHRIGQKLLECITSMRTG